MSGFSAAGLAHLMSLGCRYKLRAKVTIEDVSEDYDVWARFNPSPDIQECHSELSKSPDLLNTPFAFCGGP